MTTWLTVADVAHARGVASGTIRKYVATSRRLPPDRRRPWHIPVPDLPSSCWEPETIRPWLDSPPLRRGRPRRTPSPTKPEEGSTDA
jgi:hypothetical protein